jgi:hypothetical protein
VRWLPTPPGACFGRPRPGVELLQARADLRHGLANIELDRTLDLSLFRGGARAGCVSVYPGTPHEILAQLRQLAWQGTYRGGKRYRKQAVLEVSGGPNVSPFDSRFNPCSINRFIVAPAALERQLAACDRNPERRYVSDGNADTVAIPSNLQDRLDRSRLGNREVRVVGEQVAAGGR